MAFLFIFTLGTVFIFGLSGWLAKQTEAQDYTPLDFIADYDKFEVRVGVDAVNGRYMTYHYEFKD